MGSIDSKTLALANSSIRKQITIGIKSVKSVAEGIEFTLVDNSIQLIVINKWLSITMEERNLLTKIIVNGNGDSVLFNDGIYRPFTTTDEKTKATKLSSTSKYLDEIVDNITCKIEEDNLVIKTLDGQLVSISEINTLQGMNTNIKSLLDSLASAGMSYEGVVSNKSTLNTITHLNKGSVIIVITDETQENKRMSYIYDGSAWQPIGEFSVAIRDFTVDQIDLTKEVKNKLPQANMDLIGIAKTTDLANYLKTTDASSTYATITQVSGKANSLDVYTTTQTDGLLANKVDKVTGKSLISETEITRLSTVTNYDHTNVDNHIANNDIHVTSTDKTNLANVVASSHTHTNKFVIDKFSEVSGQPYYNGSAIGGGGGTGATINDTSTSSTTETYSIDKIKSLISSVKSFETVTVLPSSPSSDKIYILSTQNYSLNYYDGSAWHILGSNQIVISTTAPTDTTKLFLDINDKTKPILKWYDSTTTSWINIGGITQIQSDWIQTDNNKLDYIKNKPTNLLTTTNVKSGTNINVTTNGNDITINANSGDAISINNKIVDNSTWSNGRVLTCNSTTGENEWAQINITGILGSTGQLTNIGSQVSIPSGSEVVFTHPTVTDDKIMINVQQQIIGSTVTDTHVDFSDSSKYILQDAGKILVGSNKVQLYIDTYTKMLMHMNVSSFKDEYGNIITNNGVTLDTANKKFGIGSAYFNGSSYLTTPTNSNFQFGTGDFTISSNIYPLAVTSSYRIIGIGSNGIANSNIFLGYGHVDGWGTGTRINFGYWNGSSYGGLTSSEITMTVNTWHNIEVSRKSGMIYILFDGTLVGTFTNTVSFTTDSNYVYIGCRSDGSGGVTERMYGNIDEIQIMKGKGLHSSTFTIPISETITPYFIANIPLFLKTTGSSDYSLTTMTSITSITSTVIIPTNTTLKVLFSVDNGVNWLYKDATGIHKYNGDLTVAWTSSNQWSEISAYFTNLSVATLTNDLSALGIIPVTLDIAFQLNSTTTVVTPSIGKITLVYQESPHTELASFGGYQETGVVFGVKRISPTQLGVKNLSDTTKIATANIIIGS